MFSKLQVNEVTASGLCPSDPAVSSFRQKPPRSDSRVLAASAWRLTRGVSLMLSLLVDARLQRVLLALLLLGIPFRIATHFLQNEAAAAFGAVSGFEVSASTVALSLLYAGWFIRIALRRTSARAVKGPYRLIGALLCCYLLSLINAADITLGLCQVWALLYAVLIYVYLANNIENDGGLLFVIRWLVVGLGLEAAVMLLQATGLVTFGLTATPFMEEYAGRMPGTIGAPNAAAAYLSLLIPMALTLRTASPFLTDKRLAVVGMALALPALILTGSRGGWTALLISLACTAAFSRRISWKRVVTVSIVGAVGILPFINLITGRVLGDDNGSAATRIPLNAIALRMIGAHPLLGVGSNNFPLAMDLYSSTVGEWLYTVHNTYLLVWSEAGTFALLAFVGIIGVTIRTGLRWRRTSHLNGIVAVGCAAAILGHLTHMGVDLFRTGAPVEVLWILGGLTLAANGAQSAARANERCGANALTRRPQ